MKILIAPHNDDETLFAGYLVARYRPQLVIVVYDSYRQVAQGYPACSAARRRIESGRAVQILGQGSSELVCCGLDDRDDHTPIEAIARHIGSVASVLGEPPDLIIAPAFTNDGHPQHNLVALASGLLFRESAVATLVPVPRVRYTTYERSAGRTSSPFEVLPSAEQIQLKLRALACYETQLNVANCRGWFTGGLAEYTMEELP